MKNFQKKNRSLSKIRPLHDKYGCNPEYYGEYAKHMNCIEAIDDKIARQPFGGNVFYSYRSLMGSYNHYMKAAGVPKEIRDIVRQILIEESNYRKCHPDHGLEISLDYAFDQDDPGNAQYAVDRFIQENATCAERVRLTGHDPSDVVVTRITRKERSAILHDERPDLLWLESTLVECHELIFNTILSLDERNTLILKYKVQYGMTQKQIAAKLGITEAAVSKHWAPAKEALLICLSKTI